MTVIIIRLRAAIIHIPSTAGEWDATRVRWIRLWWRLHSRGASWVRRRRRLWAGSWERWQDGKLGAVPKLFWSSRWLASAFVTKTGTLLATKDSPNNPKKSALTLGGMQCMVPYLLPSNPP